MRSAIISGVVAFTAFATSVSAQYYNQQSAPFYLQLSSKNATINNQYLGSCHEGAAEEGLCLAGTTASPYGVFNYNTTSYSASVDQGILTYELRGGNFNVSEAMALEFNPVSNVAVPLFTPGDDNTIVSFESDKLVIKGYNTPAVPNSEVTVNNWYICHTYVGYSYETLAWVVPGGRPINHSCVKVDVYRRFL